MLRTLQLLLAAPNVRVNRRQLVADSSGKGKAHSEQEELRGKKERMSVLLRLFQINITLSTFHLHRR
jgi:hypothetical protein